MGGAGLRRRTNEWIGGGIRSDRRRFIPEDLYVQVGAR